MQAYRSCSRLIRSLGAKLKREPGTKFQIQLGTTYCEVRLIRLMCPIGSCERSQARSTVMIFVVEAMHTSSNGFCEKTNSPSQFQTAEVRHGRPVTCRHGANTCTRPASL